MKACHVMDVPVPCYASRPSNFRMSHSRHCNGAHYALSDRGDATPKHHADAAHGSERAMLLRTRLLVSQPCARAGDSPA